MTSCLACLNLRDISTPDFFFFLSCAVPLGYVPLKCQSSILFLIRARTSNCIQIIQRRIKVELTIHMQTAHAFKIHGTRRLRQFITSLTVIPNYNILVDTGSILSWKPVKISCELQLHVLIVWPLFTPIAGECLLTAFEQRGILIV